MKLNLTNLLSIVEPQLGTDSATVGYHITLFVDYCTLLSIGLHLNNLIYLQYISVFSKYGTGTGINYI